MQGEKDMAIDDLIVLVDDSSVPIGYTRIEHDLNEGAGGRYLYFAYHNGDQNPITAPIEMTYGNSPNVSCGAGFTKIGVDLNMGAGGEYIYTCIRRGTGDPITGLDVISGESSDIHPDSPWLRVDLDLNLGAGGRYIYLVYRTD
jgi:hypothetical protein